MEKYDKEKLHEYAKELFELCLDKNIKIAYDGCFKLFTIYSNDFKNNNLNSYISKSKFNRKTNTTILPIWELIEKVKQS